MDSLTVAIGPTGATVPYGRVISGCGGVGLEEVVEEAVVCVALQVEEVSGVGEEAGGTVDGPGAVEVIGVWRVDGESGTCDVDMLTGLQRDDAADAGWTGLGRCWWIGGWCGSGGGRGGWRSVLSLPVELHSFALNHSRLHSNQPWTGNPQQIAYFFKQDDKRAKLVRGGVGWKEVVTRPGGTS